MLKYHIDRQGKPAICRATIKCPLKTEHFSTVEECQKAADVQNEQAHSILAEQPPETECLRGGYYDNSRPTGGLSWHEYSFTNEIQEIKNEAVADCLSALKDKGAIPANSVSKCFASLPGVFYDGNTIDFSGIEFADNEDDWDEMFHTVYCELKATVEE